MAAYSYWDGGIVKDDETGKYYMFASRWNQAGGHWGKMGFPDGRGHRPFMRSVTICMDHMRIKVPFGRIGAKVPDIMSFRLHSAKMIHCTIMGIGMPFQSAIPVCMERRLMARFILQRALPDRGNWYLTITAAS